MSSTALLASTADYGTKSISASYEALLRPDAVHYCSLGFRRMGPRGWLETGRFVRGRQSGVIVCLFNAPTLLGAIFRRSKGVRCVAVLDWTESFPPGRKIPLKRVYDWIYLSAFSRMSAVFSPVKNFRNYYNSLGANIQPCLYPLPHPIPEQIHSPSLNTVRALFIGADWKRKGGDTLLEAWGKHPPSNATLTFVCPHPPASEVSGVKFLRNIKAGTPEHKRLLATHDLFILPTNREPFGFALLEALNAGMCAITTEVAGAAEVVKNFGGLVAKDSETAVQVAMQLISNPPELAARKLSCREFLPRYEADSQMFLQSACGRQGAVQK